jgi:methionyl-tRNA formyltransferase
MRIIFMGTPDFAVSALNSLLKSSHEVVAVYSQPPRAKGRGHKVQKSPVHLTAEKNGIEVLTPISLRDPDIQKQFFDFKADVAVVAAYGLILPQPILSDPKYGCINIHASLLPRWRGAAPIHRCIMTGDSQTGITIMKMDKGLDTGDILDIQKIIITPQATTVSLHDELAEIGGPLLLSVLERIDTIEAVPQPKDGITYAEKITPENGRINWKQSAIEIDQLVRSLTPKPGAWFLHNEDRIKVIAAEPVDIQYDGPTPGSILENSPENHLSVVCGSGTLRIKTLQRAGGVPLPTQEFLRGYKIVGKVS